MAGKFTARELSVCALFGAVLFFLVFTLGAGIITATGIPMSGGIANMVVAVLVLTIGKNIVPKFGSASLILTVAAIIAVPTITWGPPGIYKVPMQFLLGLTYDLAFYLLGQNKWRDILAGGAVGGIAAPNMYLFLAVLGLPGADKLAPLLAVFSGLYLVLGIFGGHVGKWIYETKLKNRAFIKQLSR
jgi:hypothetical protein